MSPTPTRRSRRSEQTDAELLSACRAGDRSAWELLLDRYERLVYSIPRSHGLTPSDASDVAQATFVALLEGLDRIDDADRLLPWLGTVARRQTWRHLERTRREPTPVDDPGEAGVAERAATGEQEYARLDRKLWLHDGLERLDGACRALLTTLYLDPSEPSYAEVAGPAGSPGRQHRPHPRPVPGQAARAPVRRPGRKRLLTRRPGRMYLRGPPAAPVRYAPQPLPVPLPERDEDRGCVVADPGEELSLQAVLDWLEGRLDDQRAARVAALVASAGERSATQVAWARRFLAARRAVLDDVPPPELRGSLVAAFGQVAGGRQGDLRDRLARLVERARAALIFDSASPGGLALSGLRSPGTPTVGGATRHLLYRAEGIDVAIDVVPDGTLLQLHGQVLPADDAPAGAIDPEGGPDQLDPRQVVLVDDEGEVAAARTDELGEFDLGRVAAGRYELAVAGEPGLVLTLDLRPPPPTAATAPTGGGTG